MVARRQGRIVNVASRGGVQPWTYGLAYATSKAALIRLSEQLALETREQGIAVFAIHPGTVRTPMAQYMQDAEIVGQRTPWLQQWFRQVFDEGKDVPIERSVELVLQLAAGKADALSGCYFDVNTNLDDLIALAVAIQQDELYTLRLRTAI